MGFLTKIIAPSPFKQLYEHSKKVHECVALLRPLTDALLVEDYDKIEELHNDMSRTEHEADQIKKNLRDQINQHYFLREKQKELSDFLSYQDDVADAMEDFAVLLLLRRTKIPVEVHDDFLAFVNQVILLTEHLITLAETLSTAEETSLGSKQAQEMLIIIEQIGQEEWLADRLERKFARHFYTIDREIDPITVLFLDKFGKALGAVANSAEKAAKYLRLIIRKY
jgi:predicted phosphate transport protein (TIGR00153 family)